LEQRCAEVLARGPRDRQGAQAELPTNGRSLHTDGRQQAHVEGGEYEAGGKHYGRLASAEVERNRLGEHPAD
jgi:hypothetical protein